MWYVGYVQCYMTVIECRYSNQTGLSAGCKGDWQCEPGERCDKPTGKCHVDRKLYPLPVQLKEAESTHRGRP